MKYLEALWQALLVFFSHLKKHQEAEQTTKQAKGQGEQVDAARDAHDREVAGGDPDKQLDKWVRD